MARLVYLSPSRSTMGVGPALVTLTLSCIVLVLAIDHLDPGLGIAALRHSTLRVIGAAFLIAAVLLYARTITAVRNAATAGQLAIDGPFRYVRHPIYATYIPLNRILPRFRPRAEDAAQERRRVAS